MTQTHDSMDVVERAGRPHATFFPGAVTNLVSAHCARLVLDTAAQSGIQQSDLAHIASVDRTELLDNMTRIPAMDMMRLWGSLEQQLGHEAGIRTAAAAAPGRLHVWDYLIRTAPTLAEGLRAVAQYQPMVCNPEVVMRVIEDDTLLMVELAGSPYRGPVAAVHSEFAFAVTLRRAREGFGDTVAPVRVDFSHRAPRSDAYLACALGTSNIHFEQERNVITFLRSEYVNAQPDYDPRLHEILRAYAQRLIDQPRAIPPWQETVRATIRHVISERGGNGVDMNDVARRLNSSRRTLQRRLADHGTTWRAELETARHQLAVALLADPARSTRSIALQLGYTDYRALSRAFQRWTGQTPSDYRRSLLIEHD
ncbi:AraC family transcriptional regulator ligand-binding domain-containing protein [Nocardia sp. NPDC046763]|uniref:AraC family transcriptional regulator ligand-binding domain-containing protein n=1 Tax=Nocardia sp. NPDC046763 TaxID=3155256 RepID=UPI0033DFB175